MSFDALPAAKAATGRIEMRTRQGWRPVGTGFVVGERVVLTALHVVADRSAPAVELRGDLRFSSNGRSIGLDRLSAYDAGDDWALLALEQPAGVSPLPVASELPAEEHGWWTFGYPGLNDVEGIPARARLLDPSAAYESGTAISLYSEELKGTAAAGLSGAPLLRGGTVYGIFRSDLEEERREGRRSFGHLYATAIGRVLDRADLRSAQPNPYQGMRPFEEDRAEYFFGRETEAAELAGRLRDSRLAVLQGGSGSGKSSLLRAGLLPLVRAGQLAGPATLETLVFQPRSWPLQELALALQERLSFPGRPGSLEALRETLAASDTAVADLVDQELHHRYRGERSRGGLLIVVDQLEELYATEERDEAQRLLRLLCAAAERRDSRVWVAGAIRDGFMADLLRPSPDTETLRAALVAVGPIATPERLRELIVRPAEKAGLTFEPPDLPDLIAQDAAEAPGGLPLLQYALDRLWQERKGNKLTKAAYVAFGRVSGVIAHHAQAVFDDLDKPGQDLAKRVFLRLVQIRADGPNTRRLLPRSALQALPAKAPALIQRFVAARLLVESAAGIEIAHEALIREWTPLREWVKAAPEGELRLQQIEEARDRWKNGGEHREDLLPPHRLQQITGWALQNSLDVPPAERGFLIESLLATEQRTEEWVPHFPVADVEEALARSGRRPEEELRLLAGLYAAGAGADRSERLARLVVQQAPNAVGTEAGRLAVDCEGADWLIDLADREPAVRNVVTGLLNEGATQAELREKLPKAWRGTVRRGAAVRLAWEQRTALLFVAATVFVAVWLCERIWWLLDLAIRVAGLAQADYLGEFDIINLPVWAGAGAYLDKRSEILGRPLTRREFWGFTAILSLTEKSLYWLPEGVHTLLYGGSSRLRFFIELLALLAAYVVAAILLMPVFARRAAPTKGKLRWLRVAAATLVAVGVHFLINRVPVDEANFTLNFARHYAKAFAAAVAAAWAAAAVWRPSFQAPLVGGSRRLEEDTNAP